MTLKNCKEEIKAGFRVIIKKPRCLFALPLLFLVAVYNRAKYSKVSIYLTSIDLSDFSAELDELSNTTIVDKMISFDPIARQRAAEDPTISLSDYLKIAKKRFDRGDKCLLLSDTQGFQVSYLFISEIVIDIPEVKILRQLPKNEAAIYDVYTFSAWRGKGYHQKIFQGAYNYLCQNKVVKANLWLMKHNTASIKAHIKVGFNNISYRYTLYKLFGFHHRTEMREKISLRDLLEF